MQQQIQFDSACHQDFHQSVPAQENQTGQQGQMQAWAKGEDQEPSENRALRGTERF